MKVYYSQEIDRDFYQHNKKKKVGRKQYVNWRFEHMGKKCMIPYIYRFSKGIVFDLITLLDEEEIRAYMKKYEQIDGSQLSDLECELIEQEGPYNHLSIREVWINGELVTSGFCASGKCHISFLEKDYSMSAIARAYRMQLEGSKCFYCQRFCVKYPSKAKGYRRLRRVKGKDKIKALKLVTREEYKLYPMEKTFTLMEENPEYEMTFTHPLTEIEHKVCFERDEEIDFPAPEGIGQEEIYAVSAQYTVVPPLGKNEELEFDSTMQYVPSKKEAVEEGYLPESMGGVEIIGGSDGPTVLFVTSTMKPKEEEVTKHYCLSKCSTSRQNGTFYLRGIRILKQNERSYEFVDYYR